MKMRKVIAMALAMVINLGMINMVNASDSKEFKFNFTSGKVTDAKTPKSANKRPRKYDESIGYGFVDTTTAMPTRQVNPDMIQIDSNGFYIKEDGVARFSCRNEKGESVTYDKSTTHNFGGMVFRIKTGVGKFHIEVETGDGDKNAIIAVNAMQTSKIESTKYWDAAQEVPNRHMPSWDGNVWSFDYANGLDFIDIEIEPKEVGKPVYLKSISIKPIADNVKDDRTVYLLGDSLLKSYLNEEAPMTGWAQVFDRLFTDDIKIVNYAMGGRSAKSMYQEGRLNDVILTAAKGDFILIQSGHNDEKSGSDADSTARYGVGSTEAMYKKYLEDNYINAIRAAGLIPIFVTPATRLSIKDGQYIDSFTKDDMQFTKVMRQVASENNVPLVDLNADGIKYLNQIGVEAAEAIVMSIEAGETPATTSAGSYANGHPQNKVDKTHMKEALAKQYARIVAEDIIKLGENYDYLLPIIKAMHKDVQAGEWDKVYTEVCKDVVGENAYYRNQIEKMVQIGAMAKDSQGNFRPKEDMNIDEYIMAINKIYSINVENIYGEGALTREVMACINYDAYSLRFSEKPDYMTELNGDNITPDDPEYYNSISEEAQYYPLIGYGNIKDKESIDAKYSDKVEKAYNLGLFRSEEGIERGKMINGDKLLPKAVVSREKASKSLYFMYILGSDITKINSVV